MAKPPGYFNPRTREGCDHSFLNVFPFLLDFNPRTREGCDVVFTLICEIDSISIHAPAKGATSQNTSTVQVVLISIHAPAKGATIFWSEPHLFTSNFNPRTREGCDFCSCSHPTLFEYFNPRTREGCDRNSNLAYPFLAISIHAPAKGATCLVSSAWSLMYYFNPRTREGCDAFNA